MSNVVKLTAMLGLALTISACSRSEPEPVMMEPAPIMAQPTFSKL